MAKLVNVISFFAIWLVLEGYQPIVLRYIRVHADRPRKRREDAPILIPMDEDIEKEINERISQQIEQLGEHELREIRDAVVKNFSSEKAVPYIVGGHTTNPKDFPYQIFLVRPNSYCGGVIITRWWILTAAHCVDDPENGRTEIFTVDGTSRGFVDKIFVHPDYDFPKYDISLGKLEQKLTYSDYVQAIRLSKNEVPANTPCIASGYGRTARRSGPPRSLHKTRLYTLEHSICGLYYQRSRSVVCADDPKRHYRGVCNGDSGGPLACKLEDELILVGITSGSASDCGKESGGVPNGFANIGFLYNWISTTVRENQ